MEASTPAKRIRVGEVISETFSIYGRNVVALVGSAFIVFVLVGIVTSLLTGPSRDELSWGELLLVLLAIVIRLAATALYTGFVVRLVEDVRDGKRDIGIGRLFSSAAPAIVPLIVMSILFGLGVGIGLILLIIPGLFLLTIWSVAAPAIVVEGRGALESFGRSRELVRGDGWSVFWTIVVVWLITAVIYWVIGLAGAALDIYGVGLTVAAFVTAPIHSLAVSVMFFNLGGGRSAPAAAPTTPSPPPAPAS